MGSNKEWDTEQKTLWEYDPDQEIDPILPQVESLTVKAFDYANMYDIHDYMHLKKKYPALQQAWDHYQMVLNMCKAKEKENEN